MNPLRLACCLASVAALAAGCTTPPPPPPPLTIGVLAPLTGPDAVVGTDAVRGAQLAVDVINTKHPSLPAPFGSGGGLPRLRGATLTLATADTRGTMDAAAAGTASLIGERHIAGLVVADTAEIAAAAGSQMQRLRVPLLDAHSTADYLTELGMDWYFRTGPSDSRLLESAFALLGRQPGGSAARIALVTEAGGDSAGASAHIKDLAARSAGTIVAEQQLPAAATVDDGFTARLTGKHPHAIFAWAHTAAGADAIIRTVGTLAGSPPLFGLGQGFRQLKQLPPVSSALIRAVAWSADLSRRSPAAQQVAALYEQQFGQPLTAAAADAFTAVIALAMAIDGAGSADPAAIRTALRQTSLSAIQMIMPWNGVRFGADGQNLLAAAVVEQWQDPSFRLVYPVELASGPARWSSAESGK